MRNTHTIEETHRGAWPTRRVVDYGTVAIVTALLGTFIFRSVYQAADDEMLALLAPVMLFIVVASFFAGGERKHK